MTKSQQLAHYIASLPDFEIVENTAVTNDHMGAVLAEAALQGGIRYETVVRPRVEVKGYDEAQEVIRKTAELLGIDERTLDYGIWTYMAG